MTSWTDLFHDFILRRPGVTSFPDIMKVAIMLINTISKDSIIFKSCIKRNLSFYFSIEQALMISGKKNADTSRIQRMCFRVHILFGFSLGTVCAKSHDCGICVTGFR